MAVFYNKHNFKCLGQKNIDGVIYIKFFQLFVTQVISVCWQFTEKNNLNIAQFVGYITYLALAKYVDLIQGDFNEDSIRGDPSKISLQSLGFSQLVLEATHIRGACLDHIYIKNTQNKFSYFEVKAESVYYSDHDPVFLYYAR